MKTQTLFAIGFGTLLVAMTGCKSPERFTSLGSPSSQVLAGTGGSAKSTDLSAPPIEFGDPKTSATTDGITGTSIADSGLPEDGDLANRELDRSVFAGETVYFDYDHSSVKTAEASKVDRILAAVKARGLGYDLLVEGHADERGTEEYNRALGERRALAIRELLMKSGLEGTRVFTRTFGKDQPAVASHDEAAWNENRRGEFVLVLPKKLITTQNTK